MKFQGKFMKFGEKYLASVALYNSSMCVKEMFPTKNSNQVKQKQKAKQQIKLNSYLAINLRYPPVIK